MDGERVAPLSAVLIDIVKRGSVRFFYASAGMHGEAAYIAL